MFLMFLLILENNFITSIVLLSCCDESSCNINVTNHVKNWLVLLNDLRCIDKVTFSIKLLK